MTKQDDIEHIHEYKRTIGLKRQEPGKNRCATCGEFICGEPSPDGQNDCMRTKGHKGNHANKWSGGPTWRQKKPT